MRRTAGSRGDDRPAIVTALRVLAVFLVASCTPAVDGLVADQNFTHDAVIKGELGIFGIVSAQERLDATARVAYSDMLRNVILSYRPEFRIETEGAVVSRVDEQLRSDVLDAFCAHGEIDAASLQGLSASLDPLRYITIARIDFDEIEHSQNESTRKSGDDKQRVFTASTRRTARVTMRVYDLKTTAVAWSASARSTKSNERSNSRPDKGDDEVWISLVGSALDVDEYPAYPHEPALRELLRDAFGDLAQNMPEKVD